MATTKAPMPARKAHGPIRYSNWMWDLDDIFHDFPLKFLCLPGTHDSATAHLRECWTHERKENDGASFIHWLENNLGISGSPVWKALLGTARTTDRDIYTQLTLGVRAFDFRVWPVKDGQTGEIEGFYGVHRFLGENYKIIVKQLCDFLERYKGEVVYARFRFIDENHRLTDEDRKQFLSWLTDQLRPYLVKRDEGSPFTIPYKVLIGGDPRSGIVTHPRSRIIIHFYDESDRKTDFTNFPARDLFFTTEEIGLHGDTNGNGSTVTSMVEQQRQYLREAKRQGQCFAMWLTTSPPDAPCIQAVRQAYKEELDPLHVFHTGGYPAHFLRDFVKPFNDCLESMLQQFSGERISAIFVDWPEDSDVATLAMQQSVRQTTHRPERDQILNELWGQWMKSPEELLQIFRRQQAKDQRQ